MKSKVLALAAVAGSLVAGQAQAAVTYMFESDAGRFTWLSADFVSSPLELTTGDLKVCENIHGNCTVRFFPELFPSAAFDTLSFEYKVASGPSVETPYRFVLGAFRTTGVHTVGGFYPASLTVSGAPGPLPAADVPEPATWALLIAGFGLAGATLRRRQTAAA